LSRHGDNESFAPRRTGGALRRNLRELASGQPGTRPEHLRRIAIVYLIVGIALLALAALGLAHAGPLSP
jgi:hypothetical protein